MASVVAVCISEKKGVMKHPVEYIDVKQIHGILGDAHAGDWHRQISLLASESVNKMKAIYPDIPIGAFAENILTEGIEVAALPKGTRIIVGSTILEITQIGKECHKDCAIRKQVGDCVMPKEGVFAIVLKDGTIKCGDKIRILSPDA